jgi:hypothetical protein
MNPEERPTTYVEWLAIQLQFRTHGIPSFIRRYHYYKRVRENYKRVRETSLRAMK